MLRDFIYALRVLRKSPGFTAVALLTLALGIGANAAIFNLVNAIVLRGLPVVAQPQQLALLTDPNSGGTGFGTQGGAHPRALLSYSEYVNLRDHATAFSGVLAAESNIQRDGLKWGSGGIEPAFTQLVSSNFFSVLGVAAYRGRVFRPEAHAAPGGSPVAILSYGFWQRHFGGSPSALGQQFRIYATVYSVIGIAPPGFTGVTSGYTPDVWIPLSMSNQDLPGMDRLHDPAGVSRVMWLQVIGRRKPGVTLQQAGQEANLVFHTSVAQQAAAAADAATHASLLRQHLQVRAGSAGVSALRGQFSAQLMALLILVGLVLLLATVNLASLLLAQAAARQKEMGIRMALGAGRTRVVRQLLTESVLLAILGGGLGVLLAVWGERVLVTMVSPQTGGITLNLAPDWRVLGFTALICLLAGVLFGLAPALRMAKLDLNQTLLAQGRGGSGRSRYVLGGIVRGGLPLGKVLVAAQVALSILLVTGSALLIRNLQNLQNAKLGFNPSHLAETAIDLSPAGYKGVAATTLMQRFLQQASALPGVQAVALSNDGLFEGNNCGLPIGIEGVTPPQGAPGFGAGCDAVTSDYFKATGIPILLGRALNQQDQSGPVIHVVINQTMQRKYFAGINPIGRQIRDLYPDDKGAVFSIVGVCADSKVNSPDEKMQPLFYLPFFNVPFAGPDGMQSGLVLLRETGSSGAVASGLRNLIQGLDSRLQPGRVQAVSHLIDKSLVGQIMLARLSGFFGVLALLLAAIGLYGVMAYSVTRRTTEFGVRLAMGATRGGIVQMVLGETGVLLAIGLVLGIPLSLGGARLIASRITLFGMQYYDPASLAAAAAVLAAVALLAGLLPALRASRVGPAECLRLE